MQQTLCKLVSKCGTFETSLVSQKKHKARKNCCYNNSEQHNVT